MKSLFIALAMLLSPMVNLHLFNRRQRNVNVIAFELEYEDKKQKNKRRQRRYKNRKYKKRKKYREKQFNLKGTNSKDHRHSNQRGLRRMYRNS